MASFSFSNIALRAISAAVPAHIKKFDCSIPKVARFVKQIGIKQVHISLTEQTAVDVGYIALQRALAKAQWQTQDLDMLIFDSQTPDYLGGVGNSSLLHHYLHLPEHCAVFDVTVGCSAFPYTLAIACSMISSQKEIKRLAIIMGDNQWCYYANPAAIEEKATMLVGEGTGAILLEKITNSAQEEVAPIKIQLFAQGDGYKNLSFHFGTKNAWRRADKYEMPDGGIMDLKGANNGTYMDGMAICDFVSGKIKNSILEMYPKDLAQKFDYFVFHQANQQLLTKLGQDLGLREEQVLSSLKLYGNTYNASALITMCSNLEKLKQNAHIFNSSYGVGLSWGFSDFVLPAHITCPVVKTEHRFDEHFLKTLN